MLRGLHPKTVRPGLVRGGDFRGLCFADMSTFTTQSYNSTAVKLLHCSIVDTPIIHNTMQRRSEKVLI